MITGGHEIEYGGFSSHLPSRQTGIAVSWANFCCGSQRAGHLSAQQPFDRFVWLVAVEGLEHASIITQSLAG